MVTQNVNMYQKPEQLGSRRVFRPTPTPISKVPTLTVGLYITGTAKYLHPESVPESSFSPPLNFDYIKMLDVM
jgi:hypothetical protein